MPEKRWPFLNTFNGYVDFFFFGYFFLLLIIHLIVNKPLFVLISKASGLSLFRALWGLCLLYKYTAFVYIVLSSLKFCGL